MKRSFSAFDCVSPQQAMKARIALGFDANKQATMIKMLADSRSCSH